MVRRAALISGAMAAIDPLAAVGIGVAERRDERVRRRPVARPEHPGVDTEVAEGPAQTRGPVPAPRPGG